MMKSALQLILALVLGLSGAGAATVPPSWEHAPHQQTTGTFWREHWYERGLDHGNPAYTERLRVNPPEIMVHEKFGRRSEARENGLMLIRSEEDLFKLKGAELELELWGGHPGTAGKRITINGRSTYELPQVGTEDGHCTYSHPVMRLKLSDLVNGWNACQFGLEMGTTFWGHMMVDEACLRVALSRDHPDLAEQNLSQFDPRVRATEEIDVLKLNLEGLGDLADRIVRVDYQAWYRGYDENGNRRETDWHGVSRKRKLLAAAASDEPPFQAEWDTSMLPAQNNVAVRAFIRFKDVPDLIFVTAATPALSISGRRGESVELYLSHDLPESFWSRAGREMNCHIRLNRDPETITRAELHVVTWTGGAGKTDDYFTLNGQPFPVAEGDEHVPVYSRLPVSPGLLRRGDNIIRLLSDTDHHGIEIMLPGPALMVRQRAD